jgi:hypothetical protein
MRIFKNKSIITSAAILLFNIAFFAIIANLLPIRFEENDDVLMASIANGTYLGEPDCHLVFINALYGCFLAMLYRMCPSVEWYTYLFAFFQIASITVASYYTIRDVKSKVLKISLLFALYSLWSYVIFFLQFTTVAGLLAFASVILFHKKHFYLGGIFFCLSVLVRYHCAGMVFILSVPILIYEYGKEWKNYLKVVAVLAFAGLLYLGNNVFYQEKEWKEYKEYNEIRGKIADNPNREKCKSELLKIMSENDYFLFSKFFQDPDILTIDVLKKSYEVLDSNSFENKLENIVENFVNKYWKLILVNFVVVLTFIFLCDNKRFIYVSVVSNILWLMLLCYVSMDHMPKYRVVVSSILPLFWLCVIGTDFFRKNSMFFFLSFLFIFIGNIGFVRLVRAGVCIYGEMVNKCKFVDYMIFRDWRVGRIVPYLSGVPIEFYTQPFNMRKQYEGSNIVYMTWLVKYPLKNGYFTYKDFFNEEAFLIFPKSYDTHYLQNSIKEHYGIDTDTIHVKESENYALIKFVQK